MSTSTLNAMLAVRGNTRLALAAALIERNAECEALRTELAVLRGSATKTVALAAPTNPVRRALPAHFIAAREAAMRTGRSVRVAA